MQSNTKLVLGGMAGVLSGAALLAGLVACTSHEPAPRERAAATSERPVEPVPSPRLEPELATTARPSLDPVPAGADAPEPSYAPTLDASGPVRVRRLIVSTGIDGHEPSGAADVFHLRAQQRIYAFVDAANDGAEPVELRVTFEPERGESAGHVGLEIPARAGRFRTWAFTRHVYTTGRWQAVVRTADGHVVGRRPFDVVE